MDPTRTILTVAALGLAGQCGGAYVRDHRTSAEIARDRLLWCQHHDPITRPNRERMFDAFKAEGYVRRHAWPCAWTSKLETRGGKPVLTTTGRVLGLYAGRVY